MKSKLKMTDTVSKDIIVHNIIDHLSFDEMLVLLDNISNWTGEFMKRAGVYIEKSIVYSKKNKLSGVILNRKGIYVLVCKGDKEDKWREAQYSDIEELSVEMGVLSKRYFPLLEKTNEIIGFMTTTTSTTDIRTFKIKYMENHRRKGSRCDQSSKTDNINIIRNVTSVFDDILEGLNKHELCVLQELLFRFFDITKKDKKIWYVNPGIFSFIDINNN